MSPCTRLRGIRHGQLDYDEIGNRLGIDPRLGPRITAGILEDLRQTARQS
jgi:hypothetical protein